MTSVFHFHPIGTAARAVWTIAALRYQAFQAHVAGGAKEVGADVALLKVTDESVAGAGRQSPQKEMAPARWGTLGPWRLCLGAQKHRQTIQFINPHFQDTHLGIPACRGLPLRVNRFTLATSLPWYFLAMRGLAILFVTFAALLVMRGQQQPHFALRA